MKCNARLTTSGDQVVSSSDLDHNHTGSVGIARAQKAVGEMKNKITDLTVAPSSSQVAVMSELPDDTLMALPRRATVSKAFRRHRKKVTDAANGDHPFQLSQKICSLTFLRVLLISLFTTQVQVTFRHQQGSTTTEGMPHARCCWIGTL